MSKPKYKIASGMILIISAVAFTAGFIQTIYLDKNNKFEREHS